MAKPIVRFVDSYGEEYPAWSSVKIKDIFQRVGTPVTVEDGKVYKEIGIRSHGKGLFYKDEITGGELGNKKVFWIEPDCFVVNIVFAWERAVARTTQNEKGMIASHRFPMYKPVDGIVDLDYITRYFKTPRGQQILILASPGGAGRNKTLGQKEFLESEIILPCIEEQRQIANFFNEIDTVISSSEEEIKALEKQRRGAIQQIFSQNVRFKKPDGTDYPNWEKKYFYELFTRNNEKNKQLAFDESKTLSIASMTYKPEGNGASTDSLMTYKVCRVGDAAFEGHENKEYSHGRFVINNTGDGIMSPRFTCLRPITKIIVGFWEHYMHSEMIMGRILIKSTKKGTMMHELVIDDFMKETILVPCIEEQEVISEFFSDFDKAIDLARQELEKWHLLKDGLMQQMFI